MVYNYFGDKMKIIILNTILVIFPILMYLFFSCYNVLKNKKIKRLIFIITMFSSLYFCLNFINYFEYREELLIFCNIPIVICYLKRESWLGIILSMVVVLASYIIYDINIYIIGCKYLLYFLLYVIFYKEVGFNYLYLKIVAVIQGFFLSFEYFMITGSNIDRLYLVLLDVMFIYVITFFCLYLFKLADNITKMHEVMENVDRENKLKDSLFKLTHEIKNPIAVCKGYLDMIDLVDVNRSKKYLKIIKSEIDRSLNVMSDFMEYSKIKINKDIIDLGLLLEDIYESFDLLASSNKIRLMYHEYGDDIYIMGDYDRLKQVFVNIIKNSIESIENFGIIEISIELIDGKVKIFVNDNGIGMDKYELDNIKNMFYTTKKNGTGLGVALSNEIVVAHGGSIEYQSVKNEGTKCIISLPL